MTVNPFFDRTTLRAAVSPYLRKIIPAGTAWGVFPMSAHRYPSGQSLVVHGWFDRTVCAGRDQGAVNEEIEQGAGLAPAGLEGKEGGC